ncbi:hypothetical protein [Promicromonospora soli]
MLKIEAVLEVPSELDFALWPTSSVTEFIHLRIHGTMPDVEVGSAVHALLDWAYDLYPDRESSIDQYLRTSLAPPPNADEARVTEGGLRFSDADQGVVIKVGCCTGLDEREYVYDFLDGADCWSAGHDPSPGGYRAGDLVRIVQDDPDDGSAALVCGEDDLRRELAIVEADLREFVGLVDRWASDHAPRFRELLVAETTRLLEIGRYDHRLARRRGTTPAAP